MTLVRSKQRVADHGEVFTLVAIAEASKEVLHQDGYGYSQTANTLMRRAHEWLVVTGKVMLGESCAIVFAEVVNELIPD